MNVAEIAATVTYRSRLALRHGPLRIEAAPVFEKLDHFFGDELTINLTDDGVDLLATFNLPGSPGDVLIELARRGAETLRPNPASGTADAIALAPSPARRHWAKPSHLATPAQSTTRASAPTIDIVGIYARRRADCAAALSAFYESRPAAAAEEQTRQPTVETTKPLLEVAAVYAARARASAGADT